MERINRSKKSNWKILWMLHVTKEAKHMFQRDNFDRPQQLKLDNNTNFIKSKNSLFQDSRYCTVFNKLINIEWIIEIT